MIGYIIVGIVSFVIGFVIAAKIKDNITIGFGNQIINNIEKNKDDEEL
jgi:hypothetical protein